MDISQYVGAARLDDSCNLPLDAPFTAAVARAEGVPRHQLTWLCQHELLRQPLQGVYLGAHLPDSTYLRTQCLILVVPDDAVICDRHAGWLHGAEMCSLPTSTSGCSRSACSGPRTTADSATRWPTAASATCSRPT